MKSRARPHMTEKDGVTSPIRFHALATFSVKNCMNNSTSVDELDSTRPQPSKEAADLYNF
jgi:hypothetical protein